MDCIASTNNYDIPNMSSMSLVSQIEGANSTIISIPEMNELRNRLLMESKSSNPQCLNWDRDSVLQGPPVPDWLQNRPNLSLNFSGSTEISNGLPLGEADVNTQEYRLMDDLLHLMVGDPGTDISVKKSESHLNDHQELSFVVDASVEPCLKALVHRILPLCQHYANVVAFMDSKSRFEEGKVNHALAGAFRTLIKDYMLLVTQLEGQHIAGKLTLQRMAFYIEKTMGIMELVSSISTSINKSKCRGGAVLSLLYEKTLSLSGCGQLQDLLVFLTEASAVPFMKMLSEWIYRGCIDDPYSEFMVIDNEDGLNSDSRSSDFQFYEEVEQYDDYWGKRYSLNDDCVPSFLASHSDLILKSGKYLNVIRDSDPSIKCLDYEEIVFGVKNKSFADVLEKTYNFASKRLLQLLMKEKDLLGHLRAIKHYFLLDQGDFVVQLLSLCGAEFDKNIDDVFPSRIESLVELALRTSSANSHTYKDNVTCTILPFSLMSQMMQILSIETKGEREFSLPPDHLNLTGLEGFALSYSVQWPLLLVIDKKSHFCYQMIFRHLLFCKHVETRLKSVWLSNKKAKEFEVSAAAAYRKALLLTQRMIYFIQNLEYYMSFEVIERHWQIFLSKVQKVENVDEVLACHKEFLNNCMSECMLQSPDLLRILTKLLNICISFSNFNLRMHTYLMDADWDTQNPTERERDSQSPYLENTSSHEASETFEQTVARCDLQFTAMVITLVDKISVFARENFNSFLTQAIYRLDFNGYYVKNNEFMGSCASPDEVPVESLPQQELV